MNRLKDLRLKNKELQEDVGKIIGKSGRAVGNYETGKRKMSPDIVLALAEHYGVTTDFLLWKDIQEESNVFPLADEAVPIPVVGKISAGLPILATENIERYEFAPSSMIKQGFTYFYLVVNGDSMNRKFNDGDIVLVQHQNDLENDEIGVFLIDDEATVKKYKTQNDLIILEPMSSNPIHTVQIYNPKEKNIKIIGKVISYQGKV